MLNLAIVIAYFVGIIAVGIYVYRRGRASKVDGFFVANRSGSKLFIIGSLSATIIGSSAIIGMSGLGFERGLTGAWWLLVGSIGLFILAAFFARKVRSFGLYTLPELAERQYNSQVGLAASVLIVIAWIGVVAAQIVAAGMILSLLLPSCSPLFLMAISAAVFIIYTALGGQYSIIRTDFVQFIILAVGVLVSLGLLLSQPQVGGLAGLADSLSEGYFSFPVSSNFGWLDLVSFLFLVGSTYVVGPDMYSRLFCAKNEKTAQSATFSVGLILIPFAFFVVLIGMGAKILFPDILPEQAFPTVIAEVLPVGASGLVIAALLATVMSSADTCLLTTSTILTEDIYHRFSPGLSERKGLMISRIGVVVIGILALLLALSLGGVIKSMLLAYTVFTSGVVIPVIAGFYRDKLKVNSVGALAAIIGGGGTALAVELIGATQFNLLGFGVCLVLLFGVSWIVRKIKPPE
jgi:SSS family solute:Na+ symporter